MRKTSDLRSPGGRANNRVPHPADSLAHAWTNLEVRPPTVQGTGVGLLPEPAARRLSILNSVRDPLALRAMDKRDLEVELDLLADDPSASLQGLLPVQEPVQSTDHGSSGERRPLGP